MTTNTELSDEQIDKLWWRHQALDDGPSCLPDHRGFARAILSAVSRSEVGEPADDVQRALQIARNAQQFENDRMHLGQKVYVNDLVWALKVLAAGSGSDSVQLAGGWGELRKGEHYELAGSGSGGVKTCMGCMSSDECKARAQCHYGDKLSPTAAIEADMDGGKGLGQVDAQWWLDHRSEIIQALSDKGLQLVSNKERVWLSPTSPPNGKTADGGREQRYFDALCWALGTGDFAPRQPGQGAFWWRPELQRRAGLKWDGDKFVPAAAVDASRGGER